jgi:DNA-binding NarL/FixJ family response regulator
VSSYLTIDAVSTSRTRIVLADDDVLLREGLAALLGRSGFEVVSKLAHPPG